MTKYATINPLDHSVYEIHDVIAAADLPVMPGAPYVVAAGEDTAKGDIYDPITATFTTPDPPDPPEIPPGENGGNANATSKTSRTRATKSDD